MLLVFDHYSFNEADGELHFDGELVRLDRQLLDLLSLFLKRAGEPLTRQQITEHLWGRRDVGFGALRVAVARLQRVLGKPRKGGKYIRSLYGHGYKFTCDVMEVPTAPLRLYASAAVAMAPLVGRIDAFRKLCDAAALANQGHGRLLLLTGEAGIGKTRLAECLDERMRAKSDTQVLWVRCRSDASAPLAPICEILRELAKEEWSAEASLDTGETESLIDVTSAQFLATLQHTPNIDHGTLDTIAHGIVRASHRRPLLLIIDDIQWADSASLRVMSYIADEIGHAPLLLLCTLRFGSTLEAPVRNVAPLWNHRNCQHIELHRLLAHDVTQYIDACVGSDHPERAELSRAVFARSEGNPFFMVDLLRSLDRCPANFAQPLKPSQLALSTLCGRLQELSAETRRVLRAAAVIGHDFDIGLLSCVAECRQEQVLDLLGGLIANRAVRAVPGSVANFAFDHELIREALYEEIPPQERAELHLRTGRGLQQRKTAGGAVTHTELAHHFLSAQPLGDLELAIQCARSAAAEASRCSAHVDARALLRRAQGVLGLHVAARPETHAGLLLQLAMVERVLGEPVYRTDLANAVAIAREHRLGRLLTAAGQLLSLSPDVVGHAEAAGVLESAAEALDPDDFENLAIVRAHLSWTAPNSHSKRRIDELTSDAQQYANRSGSARARAAINDTLLHFRAGPETIEQANEIAQQIERECELQPDLASQARRILVARFRLITAMQRGDKVGFKCAVARRATLVSQLRNAEASWHHERMLVVNAMNEGAFRQIKLELLALRKRAHRLELHAAQLLWNLDYGVYLCRTSDVGSLAVQARSALEPSRLDAPQVRAGKIRNLVAFGLHDEAAHAISRLSPSEIFDLPRDRDYLAVLCHLAAGAAAVQSREHCEILARLLGPYTAYYAVGVSFHCEGSVASHMGLLYEALGEINLACEHYAQGIEREQDFGLMPAAAQTSLRLARLLLPTPTERDTGLRLLAQVRSEAERMGMEPLEQAAVKLQSSAHPTMLNCDDESPSGTVARSINPDFSRRLRLVTTS